MPTTPIDPVEQNLLIQLAQLAQGFDPWGQRPSEAVKVEATRRYMEMKAQIEARSQQLFTNEMLTDKQKHDQRMEEERVRNETQKLLIEAENRSRELYLEEQRIQIAKADVIIRAIEAAARNPEVVQLLQVAQEMSNRLLASPQGLPALEDKERR